VIEIVVPVPASAAGGAVRTAGGGPLDGALGVLDNSKPGFGDIARAALLELSRAGVMTDDSLYVRKPIAGRAAGTDDYDRLASGAVAVLVGSGD
jgi:hypothetical protein